VATLIPTELPHRVEQLLKQRQMHVDAISQIERTLSAVNTALNGIPTAQANGAKVGTTPAAPKVSVPKANKGTRRGTRGLFALSAEASVLAFIKQKKTATTKDVNHHFKAEGRASTADNALSKLVADKKLKRLPLGKGIPGSAYTLA
jgi:hypothetical protein